MTSCSGENFQTGQAGLQQPHLRQELEEVAAENPDRFKLWYTIDRSSLCTEADFLGHLLYTMLLLSWILVPIQRNEIVGKSQSTNCLDTSMI